MSAISTPTEEPVGTSTKKPARAKKASTRSAVDRLEASFAGEVNFQYILTTTTAPPLEMREGSKWLKLKLNSRNKADRLLCEDI